jgi:hypothetical protein
MPLLFLFDSQTNKPSVTIMVVRFRYKRVRFYYRQQLVISVLEFQSFAVEGGLSWISAQVESKRARTAMALR